jgi:CRISPR-associated endonuclease Csn1
LLKNSLRIYNFFYYYAIISKNICRFEEKLKKTHRAMKRILGLDLGTNSIGWAVVTARKDEEGREHIIGIEGDGSRIIPMDAAVMGDFDKGNTVSQTADRTSFRGKRRLQERFLQRRERLHRVLKILVFLPKHYEEQLTRYGKFITPDACNLAWTKDKDGKPTFLFESSFQEMLDDFRKTQPELVSDGHKIPYDWTLYYLRKKALTQEITKEELAWILLNFNQKRGYNQLRGEEEETPQTPKNRQYFERSTITDITDTGKEYKGKKILRITLANGDSGKIFRKDIPEWIGQEKTMIATVKLKDGRDAIDDDGEIDRIYKIPTEQEWENEWALVKMKTQQDLDAQEKTVGAYIYDTLLAQPGQKIRGKLVRTIDRPYYKKELYSILETQRNFHPELQDAALYKACIEELYAANDAYRNSIAKRDMVYLLVDDVLFYQRPLKSKKSLISNCPYEYHLYTKDGEEQREYLKCIAKSHPLFQEFRLWQFLSSLRIYKKETKADIDVTDQFLTSDAARAELFSWLNDRKSIDQKSLLKYPGFKLKKDADLYRWNYVEDKSYPCNETRALFLKAIDKVGLNASFLTTDIEEALWHILYSIADPKELAKALRRFAEKHGLQEEFVDAFKNLPPFKAEYGAYSAKAIKKLLSVMRLGKYWSADSIPASVRRQIDAITSGDCSEKLKVQMEGASLLNGHVEQFSGLPVWLACYVVYGRHSEGKEIQKWESPEDIDNYLNHFKQHSMRNPIVEQVVMETLRVVRDIWKQYGKIDEIHIELGRNLKEPADKRKKMTDRILENERTNMRIRLLLMEFANPDYKIEGVRPYSPSQQELLRIYEEEVLQSEEVDDEILEILKKFQQTDSAKQPKPSEIKRYRLWLEQKYRSPYTGKPISLARLFTSDYEIEHVIPQSRYFDDSLNNKVICEAEVNKLKSNALGFEFIKQHHGEKVQLAHGGTVTIFTEAAYEEYVKEHYAKNRKKCQNLLLEDIPESFSSRQLNDSRYISRVVKTLLSNLVREDGEEEAISKNVVPCTGSVTDRLKKDWGINDVWNQIILPRFERMNTFGIGSFTSVTANGNIIPDIPLQYRQGFNKKRIDHRHHAMDAIVIACANRNIVNYLNNVSASENGKTTRRDLQTILCEKHKLDGSNYEWLIRKPWDTFTHDVYEALSTTVVSFKQNTRIISRCTNHYERIVNGKKVRVPQTKGELIAVRKSLHKDTVFGEVNLVRTKFVSLNDAVKSPSRIVDRYLRGTIRKLLAEGCNAKKIKEYFAAHNTEWEAHTQKAKIEVRYFTQETNERFYAVRVPIDTSFTEAVIKKSVTDTGAQKILLRHLANCGGDSNVAFSPDGIESMNRNICELNGGKFHQPIYHVRKYESANKFSIGSTGNKRAKFVESAKGTNLFFAIYEQDGVRSYSSIPLRTAVERAKNHLPIAPENEQGISAKYVLSPNDLVYLPTQEDIANGKIAYPLYMDRIYKFVSTSKGEAYFVSAEVSSPIVNKIEYGPLNKIGRALSGEMIREICIPLQVDRLGNVTTKE